jgi:ABC-type glycerol-3-phosphate transport system substrate-binding protein
MMKHSSPRWLSFVLAMLIVMSSSSSLGMVAQEATPDDYTPFRFDEPVSLTLMSNVNSDEAGPPPDDWAWYQRVLDDLNIDVQIEWITSDDQYTSTLRTRTAANDLPDVFQTDVVTTALLADQGLVGDWAPLLQYMPTYVRDRNVEEPAPIGTIDGPPAFARRTMTTASGRRGFKTR